MWKKFVIENVHVESRDPRQNIPSCIHMNRACKLFIHCYVLALLQRSPTQLGLLQVCCIFLSEHSGSEYPLSCSVIPTRWCHFSPWMTAFTWFNACFLRCYLLFTPTHVITNWKSPFFINMILTTRDRVRYMEVHFHWILKHGSRKKVCYGEKLVLENYFLTENALGKSGNFEIQ